VFCVASVCAVRLAACVWVEGEQDTAITGVIIWYGEWLIVSGMCKGSWIKELKYLLLSHLSVFLSTTNCTPPPKSITGAVTFSDVLF
jgi:hypothetical protein